MSWFEYEKFGRRPRSESSDEVAPARKNDHDLLIELNAKVATMEKQLRDFITKAEFWPVKMVAFGIVGAVLVAVLTAILGNVVHK